MDIPPPRPLSLLARARRRAGLSQVQLAARVGCHPQTIAVAERGALSDVLARRCADALGVPVEIVLPRSPTRAAE